MKHECKHAYELNGVNYLLCDREKQPDARDMQAVCHASCPHQRFCGEKRCAVLLPSWKDCFKNKLNTDYEGVVAAKAASKSSGGKKKSSSTAQK